MRYRLIAIDMDGTLLNGAKQITARSMEAIARAQAEGITVTLASGRAPQGVLAQSRQLSLTAPLIVFNGAAVCMPDTGQFIYERLLAAEDAARILDFADAFQTTYVVWVAEPPYLYANVHNERTARYQHLSGLTPALLTDRAEALAKGVHKILWSDEIARVAEFQRVLNAELTAQVDYFTSNPRYLEFVQQGASKGAALNWLCEKLAIPLAEAAAIGDARNDLSMLTTAGFGIAMGNAQPEVRAVAKAVTATNEEDGVAEAIEQWLL